MRWITVAYRRPDICDVRRPPEFPTQRLLPRCKGPPLGVLMKSDHLCRGHSLGGRSPRPWVLNTIDMVGLDVQEEEAGLKLGKVWRVELSLQGVGRMMDKLVLLEGQYLSQRRIFVLKDGGEGIYSSPERCREFGFIGSVLF